MNVLRTSRKPRRAFAAQAMLACATLLCVASALAQGGGAMSPYQGEQDGVSAGGNWMEFRSEDKMTAAKRVRFELVANNYFREDPDYKPRVELICENGHFKAADFNPGVRIRPDRPGFWGQPQLEVEVRIDEFHTFHGWNWRGRVLEMDKGTTRGLIGAQIFNIALRTPSGHEIAEFSPVGMNLDEVHHACDITPKKP